MKTRRKKIPTIITKTRLQAYTIGNTCSKFRVFILWKGILESKNALTKEEPIALLKEYKHDLEKESHGVVGRIKELEDGRLIFSFFLSFLKA